MSNISPEDLEQALLKYEAEHRLRLEWQEKELELKRFQAIVNTSDDAIISKSLSGVIESWNLGAEHMFGYAAPEAIGKHISLLIPAERLHEEQGIMQRVLRKETVSHYETLRLHKQGRLIDVSVSISPIMDENGEVVAITKIARDITERKAYQQAREQAEQAKLEAAMSSMHDAMFMTDAQGNFLNFNDAFVKFLRFNSKEECPKTFAEYPAILEVHLQDWEPFTEDPWLVSRALRGEVGSNVELYLLRKDTGERWVGSYSYAPIRNQQGEILGAVITARDITELKQIQLDLQESQLAANAANQAKSSFLANMSHEIRTPMNAVLGLCYLLAKRPLDEDSHSLVSKIESASQSLLAIINDILDFSKIEAGRLEIANAPFKLSEMLDHLAVLMSSAAGSKRLELIITPAEVDAVIGDSMRLQQVLVNLLSNAIKFTEHGEVELRIRVAEQQGEQALLLFSVRDTGIGISDQQLQNIFTAFAQADNTISRRFGGSGLGLTISAQLVRLMGGELQVKSSVGVGSEFRFVLPLNFDRNAEVSKSNLVDLQLLVVDDSSAARDALTLTVQHLGWQADEAASGLAAIEQIQHKADQHNLYDVLLLDWKMPGMDGLATAQYIRETLSEKSPRLHRPPIVLMVTAFDSSALQHTPGMHHVDGVLNKPVTPSILYNAIVKVLYRRSGSVAVSTLLAAQAQQRIPGIRVLLVDDSEINREVAQHILEGDGAVVSLASNGQEALDWLCAHQGAVDIVLMDMQMPVMDGLTATREIRRNPAWASLPVLALTAGVFQDSKYAAQAAGLNDFIAKPFKVERLVALIQQWTKSKGSSKGSESIDFRTGLLSPALKSIDSDPIDSIDLPGINLAASLKIWQDMAIYKTYLHKFAQLYQHTADDILKFAQLGDLKSAAALTHKLKGVASTLCLDAVAAQSLAVEAALRKGEPLDLSTAALAQALAEVCSSIATWVTANTGVEEDVTPDTINTENFAQIQALLNQLIALLQDNNPGPTQALLVKLETFFSRDTLADINAHLLDYNFRAAEAVCQSLLAGLKIK